MSTDNLWASLPQYETEAKMQETTWQLCGEKYPPQASECRGPTPPWETPVPWVSESWEALLKMYHYMPALLSCFPKHPLLWQDIRLDKRLDKMLLHLLMMGQILNIPQCLHYASICSQQVISGYRQPTSGFRDWALFFLPLAHYGNLHSHVIGGVVPCICSVYRETADPAVKKWIWKDGGKLHGYLVSPLHLRRSPAQERGQAQLWKSLWSLG